MSCWERARRVSDDGGLVEDTFIAQPPVLWVTFGVAGCAAAFAAEVDRDRKVGVDCVVAVEVKARAVAAELAAARRAFLSFVAVRAM